MTPWTASCLSFTTSQSLLKFMSMGLVMPTNHLILCCPLVFWPSVFSSIYTPIQNRKFRKIVGCHKQWPFLRFPVLILSPVLAHLLVFQKFPQKLSQLILTATPHRATQIDGQKSRDSPVTTSGHPGRLGHLHPGPLSTLLYTKQA